MGEGTLRGPLLSRISTVVVMNISWIYEVHGDPVRGKNARSYIKKEATVLLRNETFNFLQALYNKLYHA